MTFWIPSVVTSNQNLNCVKRCSHCLHTQNSCIPTQKKNKIKNCNRVIKNVPGQCKISVSELFDGRNSTEKQKKLMTHFISNMGGNAMHSFRILKFIQPEYSKRTLPLDQSSQKETIYNLRLNHSRSYHTGGHILV